MSSKQISVLLISPDEQIYSAIEGSLADQDNCEFTGRKDTVEGVNGSAISLTALHDVVLFDVDETSDSMLDTAQSICDARMPNAIIIALAPEDLPLEKARQLKKLGVDDVLPRKAINEEIVPQVDAIRARRQAQLPAVWGGQATLGKVIAVAKSRGGVGSSLVAANMANELQCKEGFFKKKAANEVAVVDLDFQFGSIAALMDV